MPCATPIFDIQTPPFFQVSPNNPSITFRRYFSITHVSTPSLREFPSNVSETKANRNFPATPCNAIQNASFNFPDSPEGGPFLCFLLSALLLFLRRCTSEQGWTRCKSGNPSRFGRFLFCISLWCTLLSMIGYLLSVCFWSVSLSSHVPQCA